MSDEERELPVLQFSVACDGVAVDPASQKLALVGVFDKILQPTVVPQFSIVNRWTYAVGGFSERVIITDATEQQVAAPAEASFTLTQEAQQHTTIHGFINSKFEKAEVHWIQVFLDGELEMAWPLPVGEPSTSTD
jgi:hypothetical protein